jgi:hypothetical protein
MHQLHQPTIAAQVDPGQSWVNVEDWPLLAPATGRGVRNVAFLRVNQPDIDAAM